MPANETIMNAYDAGQRETVSTHDLRDGDVIVYYGVAMRLRDRKSRPTDLAEAGTPEAERFGDTVWFKTDILDDTRNNGFIPAHWLKDWTVQGNKLAKWCRVKL